MRKLIRYKTVFRYDGGQKDNLDLKEIGRFDMVGDLYHIRFKGPEYMIDIRYNDHRVELRHGASCLYFEKDKDCTCDYELPFGTMKIKTHCDKLEGDERSLKFIYELYEQSERVVRVYMMVTISETGEAPVS